MRFFRDILQDFNNANGTGKLAIISNILTVITVVTGLLFTPTVLSLIYNVSISGYYGAVMATTASLATILSFFMLAVFINQIVRWIAPNIRTTFWWLWVMTIQVLLWGTGIAFLPGVIITYYKAIIW
ncbi:hypothetical protein [Paenibacillus sp. PAMC21692]|uniref:hypothetical protein n=1 Tax=Paenibacillus sp. PAMC21692 TaxID=2762320 RepID=UPI00164DBC95|nr:hypothetical protein [Paenibacillus sp. PAMC21692]QNK54555.1 hypothetical protein H7F31_18000 [Paenibacillus sp. PAMC21692]